MRLVAWIIRTLLILACCVWRLEAAPTPLEPVQAELVAEASSIQPGGTLRVGLRLITAPGWHTYWLNPGDAGLPTTLQWNLPDGFRAGSIQWPVPQRIEVPPVVSFGYEGDVLLISEVSSPLALESGTPVRLSARAQWLACKEVCLKGEADVALELPVAAKSTLDPRWLAAFPEARAKLPVPFTYFWSMVEATVEPQVIVLRATTMARVLLNLSNATVFFFPVEAGVIDHAAAQRAERIPGANGLVLTMARSNASAPPPGRLRGVLTLHRMAWQVDIPLRRTDGRSDDATLDRWGGGDGVQRVGGGRESDR